MSFIGKWVGGLAKDLGLVDTPSAPIAAPAAPTVANSTDALDTAAQKQAAAMQGGFTSNLLSDTNTYNEDAKKTSKVLLGS